ncbi:MAG: helix-turn-helix domain-containing protein [Firmicutes bacterium]|nr:helix-turn-helix domain-containing protein [Bacillota bacterium]
MEGVFVCHKNRKNAEEKVRFARQHLHGEVSISRAAEIGEADRDTIRKWVRIYETEGISGFLYERNKAYSPEIKRLTVEAYLAGEGSRSEICKRYGIRGKITLQSWIKVYNGGGSQAP